MKLKAFIILGIILALAGLTWAGGGLPYTTSPVKTAVQNLTGLSPVPANSACTTATGTKGTIATVSTTGFIGLKWKATDASGAPVVVKRIINSNTAYMPEDGGTVTLNPAIASVKFTWFSSASQKTTTLCREFQ